VELLLEFIYVDDDNPVRAIDTLDLGAIHKVCRHLIALCRDIDLLDASLVAIDGSKFKAVNAWFRHSVLSWRQCRPRWVTGPASASVAARHVVGGEDARVPGSLNFHPDT
jgi:hypothetical protein